MRERAQERIVIALASGIVTLSIHREAFVERLCTALRLRKRAACALLLPEKERASLFWCKQSLWDT